ncbi:endonuclease/exonuclease/phosphatase family protein [Streptomyces desertarenae]|uniref:Endonuclease/exonuclease/phosphatase family protein n=1 Tax=Streptomyces desertarenae TaxID=2666184 RepID=A0ABW4PLQ0_9ACTN
MVNRVCLYSSGLVRPGEDILVYYETDKAGHNCVALYPEGTTDLAGFLTFEPAPCQAGVVRFSGISTEDASKSISPRAYVLRLVPYPTGSPGTSLAEARFTLTDSPCFLVGSFTAANTPAREACSISLAGILEKFTRTVTYGKHSGDSWLTVDARTGKITGTPPAEAAGRAGHIVVTAQDDAAPPRTTSVAVTVPVRPEEGPLVDRLRIATWNMWYDAGKVWDGKSKVLRFLLEQDVDLLALQEVHRYQEPGTVRQLADRLGWYYHQYPRVHKDPADDKDVGLISRYPIDLDHSGNEADFLRSTVTVGDLRLQVCTVHLDYTSYGPDLAPPGTRRFTADVQDQEKRSAREREMRDGVLRKLAGYLAGADNEPVIVLGDFNCPSHRDWTSEVATEPRNWPATMLLEKAGFQVSYRAVHPDPGAHPGITWSPTALWRKGMQRVEPVDRIDFIFHKGRKLQVLDSRACVTGTPTPAEEHESWKKPPRFWYNEWPSDHAAVITTYQVLRT